MPRGETVQFFQKILIYSKMLVKVKASETTGFIRVFRRT